MKGKNSVEESQKLKDDVDFLKTKYNEVKEENIELRKENAELKKNLDNMRTRTRLLLC